MDINDGYHVPSQSLPKTREETHTTSQLSTDNQEHYSARHQPTVSVPLSATHHTRSFEQPVEEDTEEDLAYWANVLTIADNKNASELEDAYKEELETAAKPYLEGHQKRAYPELITGTAQWIILKQRREIARELARKKAIEEGKRLMIPRTEAAKTSLARQAWDALFNVDGIEDSDLADGRICQAGARLMLAVTAKLAYSDEAVSERVWDLIVSDTFTTLGHLAYTCDYDTVITAAWGIIPQDEHHSVKVEDYLLTFTDIWRAVMHILRVSLALLVPRAGKMY